MKTINHTHLMLKATREVLIESLGLGSGAGTLSVIVGAFGKPVSLIRQSRGMLFESRKTGGGWESVHGSKSINDLILQLRKELFGSRNPPNIPIEWNQVHGSAAGVLDIPFMQIHSRWHLDYEYDAERVKFLVESIKNEGYYLWEPIEVLENKFYHNSFFLYHGRHRTAAVGVLGSNSIPAKIIGEMHDLSH